MKTIATIVLAILIIAPIYGQTKINYFNLGSANLSVNNYEKAISYFDKALVIDPDFSNAYESRGYAKAQISDFNGAITDFTNAIAKDKSNSPYAIHNRAVILNNLKDFRGAISGFTRVIEMGETARRDLIKDGAKGISINQGDKNQYFCRGVAKENLQDIQGAQRDYEIAFKNDSTLRFQKIYDYMKSSQKDSGFLILPSYAYEPYFYYLADPDYYDIINNKSYLKPTDKTKNSGWNKELKTILGKYYEIANDKDNIIEATKQITREPMKDTYYIVRGLCRIKAQLFDSAIDDFSTALEISPNHEKAYFGRGLAKIYKSQNDSGCLDLKKAKEIGLPEASKAMDKYCK